VQMIDGHKLQMINGVLCFELKSGVNPIDVFEASEVFAWPMPSKCWVEEGDGGQRVIWTEHWPNFIVRPLEDPDFFLSFARLAALGEPREAKIIKWTMKYGLPTWEREDAWGRGPKKAFLSVESFNNQVNLAHLLLHFYTEIDHHNLVAIKARMTNPQTQPERELAAKLEYVFRPRGYRGYKAALAERFFWKKHEINLWNKNEIDLFMCRGVLAGILTELVPEVQLKQIAESPYSMHGSYHCPDLLSALYLQLYLLVLRGHSMRYCERDDCRTPFPRFGKKRFCNSTCRSAARNQG
jgi:hypothetical protein